MGTRIRYTGLILVLVLVNVLGASAQLLPEVTTPPNEPSSPKPAQIVIQTSPDAQIYLDDVYKGQASPQGRLVIENPKPGDHALRISLAGKQSYEQKVTVVAGQVTKVASVLADPAGTVVVHTSPGAEVVLDGIGWGTTDAKGQLTIHDVPAGSHDLRVRSSGKKEYRQTITVPAGQEANIEAALPDVPGTVLVQTSPAAAVFLDGSSRGTDRRKWTTRYP